MTTTLTLLLMRIPDSAAPDSPSRSESNERAEFPVIDFSNLVQD